MELQGTLLYVTLLFTRILSLPPHGDSGAADMTLLPGSAAPCWKQPSAYVSGPSPAECTLRLDGLRGPCQLELRVQLPV